MKRFFILFSLLFSFITLVSCENKEVVEILPEDTITMNEIDTYMFRDDAQYVDLRNFEAKFNSGYIDGFELIPFFDYLDYRVFDRDDDWMFKSSDIVDSDELFRLFKKDKAIFLYADGCVRSDYLKEALYSLGYERVYTLGGFYEYSGQYKVLGIGNYSHGNVFYSKYISNIDGYTYYVSGKLDLGRKIIDIRFDITDELGHSIRFDDFSDQLNYDQTLTNLENLILDDIVTTNELYDSIINFEGNFYGNIEGSDYLFNDDFLSLLESLYITP